MFAAIRLFINCRESLVEPEKIVTLFFEIALLKNITNRHVYTHCVNIQETKLNPLLVFDMNEKKNLVNSFVDKYNSLTKDETLFLSLSHEESDDRKDRCEKDCKAERKMFKSHPPEYSCYCRHYERGYELSEIKSCGYQRHHCGNCFFSCFP